MRGPPLFLTGKIDRVRLRDLALVHNQHLRQVAQRKAHVIDVERDEVVERTRVLGREVEFGGLARLDVAVRGLQIGMLAEKVRDLV